MNEYEENNPNRVKPYSVSDREIRKQLDFNRIISKSAPCSPSSLTPVRRRFLANLVKRKSIQRNSGGLALLKNEEILQKKIDLQIPKKRKELIDRAPIFMNRRKICVCTGLVLECRCFSCRKMCLSKANDENFPCGSESYSNQNHCEVHNSTWPSLDSYRVESRKRMISAYESSPAAANNNESYDSVDAQEPKFYTMSVSRLDFMQQQQSTPHKSYRSESYLRVQNVQKPRSSSFRRASIVLPEGHVQKLASFFEEQNYS